MASKKMWCELLLPQPSLALSSPGACCYTSFLCSCKYRGEMGSPPYTRNFTEQFCSSLFEFSLLSVLFLRFGNVSNQNCTSVAVTVCQYRPGICSYSISLCLKVAIPWGREENSPLNNSIWDNGLFFFFLPVATFQKYFWFGTWVGEAFLPFLKAFVCVQIWCDIWAW